MPGFALALALLASPLAEDRVDAQIVAQVSDDLSAVQLEATLQLHAATATDGVQLLLAAERERQVGPMPVVAETQLYAGGFSTGGFQDLTITVDGAACRPRHTILADGAVLARCPAQVEPGRTLTVRVAARLLVPDRYGPFGRRHRQLTLAGGWFPYLVQPGRAPARGDIGLELSIPAECGAVAGRRWFPPLPSEGAGRRSLHVDMEDGAQLPLIVLPPTSGARRIAGGRALFISRRGYREDQALDVQRREILGTLEEGLAFMARFGVQPPEPDAPLLVVEAPLRRDLAYALDGVVLVSDHAFRLTPLERFLKFHRFPLLREAYSAWLVRALDAQANADRILAADALGAWLRDRYVSALYGRAEDAFDVLQLFAFIPAIDSMLYAPQIPFVGAYFRLIDERDRFRPDLLAAPSSDPRGKLLYEKLHDRLGPDGTESVMRRVLAGVPFDESVAQALGRRSAQRFFATWRGAYPKHQYRLAGFHSAPAAPELCGGRTPCFLSQVQVERTGEPAEEPVFLRLEDEDGHERLLATDSSDLALRTLSATFAAPLDFVELDPYGRLAETPSAEVPSPRYDNRSSPRWRFLLNNFNIAASLTAGQVETALDVGFSRVRDVHWRFAVRAEYRYDPAERAGKPAAYTFEGRATYYFGPPVTPDHLSHWFGAAASADYLLPRYAGTLENAFATSVGVYYGYDNRETAWLPDAGTAVRLGLGYDRTFGTLDPASGFSADALSLTGRVLRSFRFGGGQQISLRASAAAYVVGQPRTQLLYALGGRNALRGYVLGDEVAHLRGIASAEWVHPLAPELDENAAFLVWVSGLDGALFADVAVIADHLSELGERPLRADVGYGFRLYLDYFGVRQGVMAIDLAFPLIDPLDGRARLGPPAVYIDFAQSFLNF